MTIVEMLLELLRDYDAALFGVQSSTGNCFIRIPPREDQPTYILTIDETMVLVGVVNMSTGDYYIKTIDVGRLDCADPKFNDELFRLLNLKRSEIVTSPTPLRG